MKNHATDAIYGMGVIGAMVYFFQQATTIGMGVMGFFKAFFWPAFLVYRVFENWKI